MRANECPLGAQACSLPRGLDVAPSRDALGRVHCPPRRAGGRAASLAWGVAGGAVHRGGGGAKGEGLGTLPPDGRLAMPKGPS